MITARVTNCDPTALPLGIPRGAVKRNYSSQYHTGDFYIWHSGRYWYWSSLGNEGRASSEFDAQSAAKRWIKGEKGPVPVPVAD